MSTITALDLSHIRIHDPDSFVERFPYEWFDELRRDAPVAFLQDDIEGVPFWAVTRHADVKHVSRNANLFSSYERTSIFREPTYDETDLEQQRLMMVNMDPPEHTRLRSIVNNGFTPRMINRLEGRIRQFCDKVIDDALAAGSGDFVKLVSAQLPLDVIAEIMGAAPSDRDTIFDLSNRLIGFDDPKFQTSLADAKVAAAEMYVLADRLRQEHEADPQDDVVHKLMTAEIDGEGLSDLEFGLFFLLLNVAGNETTRNAISHGLVAMMQHPEQWELLKSDPEQYAETAADEIIRWAHPVIQFRRTAMEDTEIGGTEIPKGSKVVIYYASANRDEEVFADPYVFDITRSPNDHISFGGGGAHFCLGSHLAKREVAIMFEQLATRMPDIALAGDPVRLRSNFINGILELPATFA
ncbi:MAG: cytochrome P450 [Nitriliruptorales bacterium]|nr:cytochrome P450 [Nitriliruptorales bacterium]